MPDQRDGISEWAAAAADFAYRYCGVDPALRIAAELGNASDFEALLYQTKPQYRDHLFHVLRVCAVGYQLLRAEPTNCFGVEPPKLRSEELSNWSVAALFHDLGYMLEVYRTVAERGQGFASAHVQDLLKRLESVLLECTMEMNRDAQRYGLRVPLGNRMDHGVVSFFHLRRLLRGIDRGRDPTLAEDLEGPLERQYRRALCAIVRHSLLQEPISVITQPAAALLIICDELQEWGRWRLKYDKLGPAILELISLSRISGFERRRLTEKVTFDASTVSLADGRLRVRDNSGQIWVRVEYADQNSDSSLFEPLTLLMYKLFNFQRLDDADRLRVGLELRFKLLSDGTASEREMDILADFVSGEETEARYIDSSLFDRQTAVDARRSRPVTYIAEPNHDVVHVNLSLMGRRTGRPLLSRPPWEFAQDLLRFKRKWTRERGIRCRFLEEEDG